NLPPHRAFTDDGGLDGESALPLGIVERHLIRRAFDGASVLWAMWGPTPNQVTFNDAEGEGGFTIKSTVIGEGTVRGQIDPPEGVLSAIASEWTTDRRHLVSVLFLPEFNSDLGVWSESEGWQWLTRTPEVREAWPTVSPDGRWLAYGSFESGRPEVYVRPFLREGEVIQVSGSGGVAPVWARDGSELFYRSYTMEDGSRRDWATAVRVTEVDGRLELGSPAELFESTPWGIPNPVRSWDVGPDGRFLMFAKATPEQVQEVIEGFCPDRLRFVQNWASRLQGE
ncbi:MAG: hypothetical protein AAFX05_12975, partial [Planctomycetota bacterium]